MPTRNTINQRASRARRKSYIADLERRVRDYERNGVLLTAEIQTAARKVAEENRLLKGVLRTWFGVREEQLQELLRLQAQVGDHGRPRGSAPEVANKGHTRTPLTWSSTTPTSPSQETPVPFPRSTLDLQRDESRLMDERAPQATWLPSPSDDTDLSLAPEAASTSMPDSITADTASTTPPCGSPNSTPCEQAALIIASMRGGAVGPRDVLSELGCTTTDIGRVSCGNDSCAADKCSVDNVKLFNMMDSG